MFAVITLENTFDVLAIPIEWIEGFDILNCVNEGINSFESHVVFLSNDIQMPPIFSAQITPVFNYIDPGCFCARLNKFFGK